MKHISILLLAVFATNLIVGQHFFSVDTLMRQKRVKTKTQYQCDRSGNHCKILYKYLYDKEGRLVQSTEYSENDPFVRSYYRYNNFNKVDTVYNQFSGEDRYVGQVYLFDTLGNLIEYQNCFEGTGCQSSKLYEYNSAGRLAREIEIRDGKKDTEYVYLYDSLGNNIQVTTKYANSDMELKEMNYFNKYNEKIKSITYGLGNARLDSTKYSYDQDGNLVSLKWMGGLNIDRIYKYDSNGNVIEYRAIGLGGQIKDHRVTTYNHGLVQSRIHYEGESIKHYLKFEYELY